MSNESSSPSIRYVHADDLIVEIIADDDFPIPAWIDREKLRQAIVAAARLRECRIGRIGVLLTGDEQIREINRNHLDHDYATDVISFGYEYHPPRVEGELVASIEMAFHQARRIGRDPLNELLMYVIHGTLHIAGMDDQGNGPRLEMRCAESQVLSSIGVIEQGDFGADRFYGDDGMHPHPCEPAKVARQDAPR